MKEQKQIMFVCTGNTCRSPMAEYLFRYMCRQDNLPIRVISRGTKLSEHPQPMNKEAAESLKRYYSNIEDTSKHASKTISLEDLIDSDLVFTMSQVHKTRILEYLKNCYVQQLKECAADEQEKLCKGYSALRYSLERKILPLKALKRGGESEIKDPYFAIITPVYRLYMEAIHRAKNKQIKDEILKLDNLFKKVEFLPDFGPFGKYKDRVYDSCRDEIKENLDVLLNILKIPKPMLIKKRKWTRKPNTSPSENY